MGKKFKIRISEQDLSMLIAKSMFSNLGNILGTKNMGSTKDSENDLSKEITPIKTTKTSGEFTELDLNKPEDYKAYQEIADKFISSRSSNLLGIRGSMLADAAKSVQNRFGKYVPVELSLGQLASEGAFSNDPKSRAIRTKNPYNVGNVDSGKNEFHPTVQSGIQRYYDLMAKSYLTGGKTTSDLLNNFVNVNGNRYASAKNYEQSVSKIASQVQSIAEPVYASLSKKTNLT